MADPKQVCDTSSATTDTQKTVTVNFQPQGDLRKTITWILTNKQREDLRKSLGKSVPVEGEKANEPKNNGPKQITKRSVKIIKIVPKRKVIADKSVLPGPEPNKVKSVIVSTLKSPMHKKKCNRCKKRGHINKLCPQNPRNKMLIPPPPSGLLTESEDAGTGIQLHVSEEEMKELEV